MPTVQSGRALGLIVRVAPQLMAHTDSNATPEMKRFRMGNMVVGLMGRLESGSPGNDYCAGCRGARVGCAMATGGNGGAGGSRPSSRNNNQQFFRNAVAVFRSGLCVGLVNRGRGS